MKLRSVHNVDHEVTQVGPVELVGLSTDAACLRTEGQIERLQAQVDNLEQIMGRLLGRIAEDDQDAINLAGVQYRWVLVPEPKEKRK